MTKYTFTPENFKAFDVDGLDERMEDLMNMLDLNFIN